MELKTFEKITMYVALCVVLLVTTVNLAGCECKSDSNSDTSEDVSSNNSSESVQYKISNDNSKQQVKSGNNEQTFSGIGYGAIGGVGIQIGKNALLNLGIQYLMLTTNPEDWEGDRIGNNQLALEAGFSVFFGK